MSEQLRNSGNTRARAAGILAYGTIAEGCTDYLKQNLQSVISIVVSGLTDIEP